MMNKLFVITLVVIVFASVVLAKSKDHKKDDDDKDKTRKSGIEVIIKWFRHANIIWIIIIAVVAGILLAIILYACCSPSFGHKGPPIDYELIEGKI
jgi:1,4-dihydroxy-2-naphthoate octaprenyltransferase